MKPDWVLASVIDILGVKGDLAKDEENGTSIFGEKLKRAMDRSVENIPEDLFIKQIISDTLIIVSKADINYRKFYIFLSLFKAIKTIFNEFMNEDLFVRGGIDCGTEYREGYFLYSHPVSCAHLIEKNVAIFPRVVISDNVFQILSSKEYDNERIAISKSDLVLNQKGTNFVNIIADDNWEMLYRKASSMYRRSFEVLPHQDIHKLNEDIIKFTKHLWFEDYLFQFREENREFPRYIKMNKPW